jgi:hypothetical protein
MNITEKTNITITADKDELKTIINDVEEICTEAVEHVGSANYQEREDEALESVANAFTKLRGILLGS